MEADAEGGSLTKADRRLQTSEASESSENEVVERDEELSASQGCASLQPMNPNPKLSTTSPYDDKEAYQPRIM